MWDGLLDYGVLCVVRELRVNGRLDVGISTNDGILANHYVRIVSREWVIVDKIDASEASIVLNPNGVVLDQATRRLENDDTAVCRLTERISARI